VQGVPEKLDKVGDLDLQVSGRYYTGQAVAGGMSEPEILAEYPDLEVEDIRECLRFAAASAMERELALPPRLA
jgi:hypothetical protein